MTLVIQSNQPYTGVGATIPSRVSIFDRFSAAAAPFVWDLLTDGAISHDAVAYNNNDGILNVMRGNPDLPNGIIAATTAIPNAPGTGGMNLAPVNAAGNVIKAPAGALSGIYSGGQNFAAWGLIKFPVEADYSASGSVAPIFTTADANQNTEATMLHVQQQTSTTKRLYPVRQKNGSAAVSGLFLVVPTAVFGNWGLWMFDRNALTERVNIYYGNGLSAGLSVARDTDNVADYSAKVARWGIPNAGVDFTVNPASEAAYNFVQAAGGIFNLAQTSVDMAAFGPELWAYYKARLDALPTS